jgi:hypothetical protein
MLGEGLLGGIAAGAWLFPRLLAEESRSGRSRQSQVAGSMPDLSSIRAQPLSSDAQSTSSS